MKLLIIGLLAFLASSFHTTVKERPNVVLFYVDDLGWRDVTFMGSEFYETPNVDRLASEGMVFTNAYANAPNCAPSRACLMSGQYSPRHGIYTVGSAKRGKSKNRKLIPIQNKTVLDEKIVTLAEVLDEAGYRTAQIGKWHLGDDPTTQGFDVNVAGNKTGSPKGGYFSPYKNPQLSNGPEGEYLTDRLTDEALAFIEESRDEPFFLYLPHYAVHTPIQCKPELKQKYADKQPDGEQNNAKYAAMIDSMDQSLGRVLAKLDELELSDNTIVIFTSDNGGHGGATSNAPLRGAKGMLYEGGIRVPLAVRWPSVIASESSCPTPVIGVDFMPTLIEACGAKAPEEQPLDGASLMPLFAGKSDWNRAELYWHFPAYLEAGKRSDSPWRTTPAGAIRVGKWKLIEFYEDGRRELYDLDNDAGEEMNIHKVHPQKAKELHALLDSWRKKLGAPVPTELNPEFVSER